METDVTTDVSPTPVVDPDPDPTGADACVTPEAVEAQREPLSDEALARAAKALAHPARLRIVRVLAAQDTCVTGDLISDLSLAQSTISEHLRILREAGLVRGEVDGPRVSYCLDRTGLAALKTAVAEL